MSWKSDIRKFRREREDLLEKERELRTDLNWQFTRLLLMAQAADLALSLLGRIAGRRSRRR